MGSPRPAMQRLEPRRLLSTAAPGLPDLLAASDSGHSGADDVTNFNNAGPSRAPQFLVPGTVDGALVTVWADGRLLGRAMASGAATVVPGDGLVQLADGVRQVTARQTLPGGPDSPPSPTLALTVDATAPGAPGPPDLRADSDGGAFSLDDVTNDHTPTFDLPGTEPLFRLYRGDTLLGGPTEPAAPYTAPPQPDGTWAYAAVAVDTAGNESPRGPSLSVTIDTVAPQVGTLTGALDDTFGTGGRVVTPRAAVRQLNRAVAVQPDGKVVAAGSTADRHGNPLDFVLHRVNADGTPDPSFGANGLVITHVEHGDSLEALAVLPDGKLLAAGHSGMRADGAGVVRTTVVRYLPDGRLDPAFGSVGVVRFDGIGATALAVFPDGRFVVGGEGYDGTAIVFGLARFTADGEPDPTFGTGGRVFAEASPHGLGSRVESIDLLPDGRIIAAGSARNPLGTTRDPALMMFRPDGTVDAGFGDGGRVVKDLGAHEFWLTVKALPDDRFVASGFDQFALGMVGRFLPSGAPDPTFGVNGLADLTANGTRFDMVQDLVVLPDHSLAAIGSAGAFPGNDMAVLPLDRGRAGRCRLRGRRGRAGRLRPRRRRRRRRRGLVRRGRPRRHAGPGGLRERGGVLPGLRHGRRPPRPGRPRARPAGVE